MSTRIQHSFLLGLIAFVIYASRNILHMALLDMVERNDMDPHPTPNATCYVKKVDSSVDIVVNLTDNARHVPTQKFDWDEGRISMIEAAYYFGYIPAMIPGTAIGIRVGYFNYVSLALLFTSFSILTFPVVTNLFGFYGAFLSRVLLGVIHGPITSILSGTWFYWSLQKELTTLNAIYQIGVGFGLIVPNVVGGSMLNSGYHWPAIFYVFFALSIFCLAIFFLRASERPELVPHMLDNFRPFQFSKTISQDELKLLSSDRPVQSNADKAPWMKIVMSSDIWLFTAAWFCASTTLVCYHTYSVRFFRYLLFIDMGSITNFIFWQSFISLPILMVASRLADRLRLAFPTPTVRKALYAYPSGVVIVGFVVLGLYSCNYNIVAAFMLLIATVNGTILTVSCKPLPNEMGGKFASQVYAFSNTIGSFAGIIGPMIFGNLIKSGPLYKIETWYYAGIFTAGIQMLGAFLIMMPNLTYLSFTTESPPIDENKMLEIRQQNDNVLLVKDDTPNTN